MKPAPFRFKVFERDYKINPHAARKAIPEHSQGFHSTTMTYGDYKSVVVLSLAPFCVIIHHVTLCFVMT